jgi:tetratricopeptide (TPR) repeat protein
MQRGASVEATATLDSRGLTYLKMGQWDSAVDDYNEALRIDPKLASSLYGRGLAKLKKGDTTGGNAHIAAARPIGANIVGDFTRYGVQ